MKDSAAARRVQKADREKLRRDRLNEQFVELGRVLGEMKTHSYVPTMPVFLILQSFILLVSIFLVNASFSLSCSFSEFNVDVSCHFL